MKVTYQRLAIVDTALNLLVTPEGMEPKKLRFPMAMTMINAANFETFLCADIRDNFGITEEIELEDGSPPLPEFTGGEDISLFFGGCSCCCHGSSGFGRL